MMKVVAVLCLVFASAYAQTPAACESPKQWEGRIVTVDPRFSVEIKGRISYDETDKRYRVIEEIEQASARDFYDTILLFNERKEYRVNLKTRTCTTRQLTTPFFPFGVPPGAIFDYEVVIGAAGIPGESVTVAEFHGKGQDGSELFGTVTEPDCIPVRSGYISNSTGLVISQFYDISVGITDPMAFIPPSECNGK